MSDIKVAWRITKASRKVDDVYSKSRAALYRVAPRPVRTDDRLSLEDPNQSQAATVWVSVQASVQAPVQAPLTEYELSCCGFFCGARRTDGHH